LRCGRLTAAPFVTVFVSQITVNRLHLFIYLLKYNNMVIKLSCSISWQWFLDNALNFGQIGPKSNKQKKTAKHWYAVALYNEWKEVEPPGQNPVVRKTLFDTRWAFFCELVLTRTPHPNLRYLPTYGTKKAVMI